MRPKKSDVRPGPGLPDAPPASALSDRSARLIAFILVVIFAAQALWHARAKTSTFDEGGHLVSSYAIAARNDTGVDTTHPPLVRRLFGLPLVWRGVAPARDYPEPVVLPETPMRERPDPQIYYYAAHFLFRNVISAEEILFGSRTVSAALGSLLGLVIFLWTRALYGNAAAILSLTLFAFCPNLIANGSLVTTDMGGVAFAVLFLFALFRLTEKPSVSRAAACGAALGLALLAKFTNLFLPAVFLVVFPTAMLRRKTPRQEILGRILIVIGVSWLVLCAGYGFQGVTNHTLPAQDWEDLKLGDAFRHIFRWIPLPQNFMHGILSVLHHANRGHSAFLMGGYSVNGWWYYFPAAFAVKTPTVTLALAALWAAALAFRKIRLSVRESGLLLLALIVLWTSMKGNLNIGVRHILILYPMLYILLGQLANLAIFAPSASNRVIKFLGVCGILLLAEVSSVAPHYLAFFNRAAGGPEKGVDYLSDSNIDWGQDLNGLGAFMKMQPGAELVASYFGTGVPPYFGLRWQPLPTGWSYPRTNHINSIEPIKEYLAVSVTNLQGTYFVVHDLYGWLRKKLPAAKIGYSIYVYDITDDLESQEKILGTYRMVNQKEYVPRMEERIARLKKKLGS